MSKHPKILCLLHAAYARAWVQSPANLHISWKIVTEELTFHESLYSSVYTVIKVLQDQDDFVVAAVGDYRSHCTDLEQWDMQISKIN